jgi:hypothetical protein
MPQGYHIFSFFINHIFLLPILQTTMMLQTSHSTAHPKVHFDLTISAQAPIQNGAHEGYFSDKATHMLLGLEANDYLLEAGTYGPKELGRSSVAFSLLHEGSYNQHLMPFVPHDWQYMGTNLVLHQDNKPWCPQTDSVKALTEVLNRAMIDALMAVDSTLLSLPCMCAS